MLWSGDIIMAVPVMLWLAGIHMTFPGIVWPGPINTGLPTMSRALAHYRNYGNIAQIAAV